MMRVEVRGVTYNSADEAAKALGVARVTVYSALSKGKQDTLGLGRGNRKEESRKSGKGVPITFGKVTFPSIAAASVALGFRPKYLATALQKGQAETLGRIAQAALRYTARQSRQVND